jgi:dihydroxy-acid dehydratase
MAHSVDIEITLKDFQDISDKTPLLADLKPSGKYLMEDLHEAGGVPAVMKYLLKQVIAWRLFNSDWKNIS